MYALIIINSISLYGSIIVMRNVTECKINYVPDEA